MPASIVTVLVKNIHSFTACVTTLVLNGSILSSFQSMPDCSFMGEGSLSPIGKQSASLGKGKPMIYLDHNMIIAAKITEAPRNNSVTGYGKAIPTQYMVKLDRGPRSHWQRVYAICYSNAASYYVKAGALGDRFLDVYCFERIEELTGKIAA